MRMSTSSDSKPDNYQINARICRLVERYACMYDRSHPHYLKKDVVDKAWVKISKEMDDSIPSCKERWRNIRTSFARSINVNKVPSSANRTKPYYLHEELQFLARHITPGIPVARRPNYYSSAGEESEMVEVPIGEESLDGFAAMLQKAEAEAEGVGHQEENATDEQKQISNSPNIAHDVNAEAAERIEATLTPTPSVLQQAEQTAPMELVTEPDVAPVPITTTLYPLKKRLRTAECMMMSEAEPECDVKPVTSELSVQDADFDVAFLQGLLPEMKAMDFRQKILFKKRIYEVIGEIFEGTTQQRNTTNGVGHAAATAVAASGAFYTNGNTAHNKGACNSTPISSSSPSTYDFAAFNRGASNLNLSNSNNTSTPMTIVNASDLALIQRLSTLLQSSTVASSTTAVTALPKNVASISSTVRTAHTPPSTTVAIHRGAPLTRASANLMRMTMVNPTMPATSSTSPAASHFVKQEILDD